MKIALILWDISKIGGILTFHQNIKRGLVKCGHRVEDFFVSYNKKKLPTDSQYNHVVGIVTDDFVKDFTEKLESFDLLIFSHPCPTKTKSFDDERWKQIYELSQKKICVFHDPLLEYNYKWILDVKEHIDLAVCVQKKAYDVVNKYFDNVMICGHPMDLTYANINDFKKEDVVISPHQFKAWKHIDIFIRAIPYMNDSLSKEVYNGGIEYHYMSGKYRKNWDKYNIPIDDLKKMSIDENISMDRINFHLNKMKKYREDNDWIWECAVNSGMKYYGHVTDAEIMNAFERSKCMVDMSTGERGTRIGGDYKSVNYSILEAMSQGSIPIVRNWSILEGVVEETNAVIVSEDDLVQSLASAINFTIDNFDNFHEMRTKNLEHISIHFDCGVVAKKILLHI